MKFAVVSFFICASAIRMNKEGINTSGGAEDTCDPNLRKLLHQHAVNNTVVFTALDLADDYQDMIKNFACGVRRVGLPLLIWSITEQTHSKMMEFGYPDLFIPPHNKEFSRVKPFGQDYNGIVQSKPKMMQAVLNCGFNYLFVDSDLGFAKNPLPYFEEHQGDVQISTNYPQKHMNTGVVYMRNTPQTRTLMGEWVKKFSQPCKKYCGDQEMLSRTVEESCHGFHVPTGTQGFFIEDSKSNNLNCSFLESPLKLDLLPPGKFVDGPAWDSIPHDKRDGVYTYHPNFSGMTEHPVITKKAMLTKVDVAGMNMWCHVE